MKRALLLTGLLLLLGLLYKAPKIALVLAGVAAAALLVARFQRREPVPAVEETHSEPAAPPVVAADRRVASALSVGRRELGLADPGDASDIEVNLPEGKVRLRPGFHGDVPFIALRALVGEETEMAFIIRRQPSGVGLPPLVDNTPIEAASIEYRLRSIPLTAEVARLYGAGSNRPRLFRQLLDHGLESDIAEHLFHSRYRLEDVVYGGTTVTLVVQPAADPTQMTYVHDCLEFTMPIITRLRAFLAEATIPSAQS